MFDLGGLADPGFLAVQCLNGLTQAMFLFLIASGLTLIFGVLGVLNFAHGSLYMLGAYLSYTVTSLFVGSPSGFWISLLLASVGVAIIGALVEATFLRPVYRREELEQLLVTYALVLIISDAVKFIWGPDNQSISRPALLAGSVDIGGRAFPTYNLLVLALGPLVAVLLWLLLSRTQFGRLIRASANDREMVGVVGVDVSRLFTGVFALGAWLGGLGGGLAAPVGAIYPGMDVRDHRGVVHRGRRRRHGQLDRDAARRADHRPAERIRHPVLSALSARLRLRADGRRARRASMGAAREAPDALSPAMRAYPLAVRVLLAAVLLLVPLVFPHFYLLLATEVLIMGLFAVAFNLLLGYAGMVSFGHAAFYGLGAYACGLLLKKAGAPFAVAFLAAPIVAAVAALVFGLLCIRLTRIYFSMLTLAFSQLVWAVAHKWYSLTGGDNGLVPIPVPEVLTGPRAFYLFTLASVAVATAALWRLVNAPFGRTLLAIRENAERAEFVGIHVRRVQLVAFVVSGGVSGLAGGLFALFSRGAFPDYAFWTKSAEVLLMTLLGGPYVFLGPALGAGILIVLNSVVTSFTEYWPVVLGVILLTLIYVFPGGVMQLVTRRRTPAAADDVGIAATVEARR